MSMTAVSFNNPNWAGWQERPTATPTSLATEPGGQYGRAHWWECVPAGDDGHESGISAHGLGPTVAPGAYIAPIPTRPAPAQWCRPVPQDDAGYAAYLDAGHEPAREEWGYDRPVPYMPLDRPLQRYSAGYYSLLSRPNADVRVAWARRYQNSAGASTVLARVALGDLLGDLVGRPVWTRAADDDDVRVGPPPRLVHAELLVQLRDASSGSGRRTWELADLSRCRLTVRSRRTGEVTRWRLRDRDAQDLLVRVVMPALAAQALDALVATTAAD